MKQYFQIQQDQGQQQLFFFEQGEPTSTGGFVLNLVSVVDIDGLGEDWDYVRMAGDFPVFIKKSV